MKLGAESSLLGPHDQHYLVHALEGALGLCEPDQLLRWAQGPLQAVLPHHVLVCIRASSDGEVLRIDCLHGGARVPARQAALCDPVHGVAPAAQRLWRQGGSVPLLLQRGDDAGGALARRLAALDPSLTLEHALAHGSPALPGGSTFFLLCGLPRPPGARQARFLELLLPHMHLALQRISVGGERRAATRALSPREAEVLHWLREGKSNDEIGQILGISGLTVKNHLQRLYKLLGVSNRAHAVARGAAGV